MILISALLATLSAPVTIDAQRWDQRLLILFAPVEDSAALMEQRAAVMPGDAEARDLLMVTVVGDRVTGARDAATALRRRYGVPADGFRALLIGKDGGVKIDSMVPISGERLRDTIDAMPIRRDEMRQRP